MRIFLILFCLCSLNLAADTPPCDSTNNCASCIFGCQIGCCQRPVIQDVQMFDDFFPNLVNATATFFESADGFLHATLNNMTGQQITAIFYNQFGTCQNNSGPITVGVDSSYTYTFTCPTCPSDPIAGFMHIDISSQGIPLRAASVQVNYTFCCPCVRTTGYWQCDLTCWSIDPNTQFCDFVASLADAGLNISTCPDCETQPNLTLEGIMNSPSKALWFCLARQWVAAAINILRVYGSFTNNEFVSCIQSNFLDAGSLLATTVCDMDLSLFTQQAITDKKHLERFNLGLFTGNDACPDNCNGCSVGEQCITCNDCNPDICHCGNMGCPTNQNCEGCLTLFNAGQCGCQQLDCDAPIQCEQCQELQCDCAAENCPLLSCDELGCSCENLFCKTRRAPIDCDQCKEECSLCSDYSSSSSSSSSTSSSSWFSR